MTGVTAVEAFRQRERLIRAIREHRDQRGDDRCWLDDVALYNALAEVTGEDPTFDLSLPPKAEFLASCERYYEQRRDPSKAPACMTIRQLQDEIGRLNGIISRRLESEPIRVGQP